MFDNRYDEVHLKGTSPEVLNKTIQSLAGLEPQPDWIKESPTKAGSRYNELQPDHSRLLPDVRIKMAKRKSLLARNNAVSKPKG